MPRTAKDRPTLPFVPLEMSVAPVRRGTTRTRATKTAPARDRPFWEVLGRVDGMRFGSRFSRAGEAEGFAEHLRRGRALGWAFDAKARRFIDPDVGLGAATLDTSPEEAEPAATVFTWTERYWQRKWSTLEPKPRGELARYLNRARRFFVDTPPTGSTATAVDAYLRSASLVVRNDPLTDPERIGKSWVAEHSVPLASVGHAELERLMAHYARNHRDPDRLVSPTSQKRMAADLKQCWARAATEGLLAANPWDKVDLRTRSSRSGRPGSKASMAADAELVLSPEQIWQIADACVTEGTWGEAARCYVLVMGFCGLRPNEAVGLVVGDLDLDTEGRSWITVRRSRRRVPDRYLDVEEDPEWGPLKGRDLADSRRVPVPAAVAAAIQTHVDRFCVGAAADSLVFHRNGKAFELSQFGDLVWAPARRKLFPPLAGVPGDSPLQPKLSRLRRHDLRHSACSMWLRARADVSVCQKWSGHKRLSVFLDVYQGLIPGREEEGFALVEASLVNEHHGPV
jgi:integrase